VFRAVVEHLGLKQEPYYWRSDDGVLAKYRRDLVLPKIKAVAAADLDAALAAQRERQRKSRGLKA
jgi:hypothetical protein